MATKKEYRVKYSKRDEQWIVQGTGNKKPSGKFAKKSEATARGKDLAAKQKADLVIYKQDGKVQSRHKHK